MSTCICTQNPETNNNLEWKAVSKTETAILLFFISRDIKVGESERYKGLQGSSTPKLSRSELFVPWFVHGAT